MTNLVLVQNGAVAEYPLTRERICAIIATQMEADGAEHVQVTLPHQLNDLDLSEYNILPVAATPQPALLPGQAADEIDPALVAGVWTQKWAISSDLAAVKTAMLAKLANRRWEAEEGGTMFNGAPLATDRVTQNKLMGAFIKASADPAYTVQNWKLAPGVFATLDAATIIAAGDAVADHVQECFDNEAELTAAIMGAADFEALQAVDLEQGWP